MFKYIILFLPLFGCVFKNKEYKETNMSQFSEVKELNELLISNVPKDSLIISNGIEGESVFRNDSTNMSELDSIRFSQITRKYILHIHGSREKGFEYEYDASFGKDLSTTTFYSYVYFEENI